ncbi:MAG: M42 family metallopeptidase [Candidatus Hodarchaeota archaeon]
MAEAQIHNDLMTCLRLPGQSGFEKPIRDYLIQKLSPYGEISKDNLGSIICKIKGKTSNHKWYFGAHMDTCGFIVHSIDSNGIIKCANFGYQSTEACQMQPVAVTTSQGKVNGLMYAKATDKKKSFTIDLGMKSSTNVRALGIKAGDPVHFTNNPYLIGNPAEQIICSPRLDNRFGIFELMLLANLFKQYPPSDDVYLVATVEEEMGARGAKTTATKIKPDLAIILDITYDEPPVHMGLGPVITLSDKSSVLSSQVRDFLLKIGEDCGIPLQTEVWNIGSTDAGSVRTIGEGVPTIPILTATKNNHTPHEIGCIKDCYAISEFCLRLVEFGGTKLLEVFNQ